MHTYPCPQGRSSVSAMTSQHSVQQLSRMLTCFSNARRRCLRNAHTSLILSLYLITLKHITLAFFMTTTKQLNCRNFHSYIHVRVNQKSKALVLALVGFVVAGRHILRHNITRTACHCLISKITNNTQIQLDSSPG